MRPLIEICAGDEESVEAAEKGGADRVELCSDLFEGGLAPSLGTLRIARRKTKIKINAMVRPRGGDFCYSDREFEVMMEDAHIFKEEGADGIVFGCLSPDGSIDKEKTAKLIDISRPLPVTFHRAFDMSSDPYRALEDLIELGVDRILTSGQEATAIEGADLIRKLIEIAADRTIIMPGSGIKERNFQKLHSNLNAREYHMSLSGEYRSRMCFHPSHIHMGGTLRQNEFLISHTDEEKVRSIISLC